MKNSTQKISIKRKATAIVGVLVAALILLSSSIEKSFESETNCKKLEQTNDESHDETLTVSSHKLIVPIVQFNLFTSFNLLFKIELTEDFQEKATNFFERVSNTFFRILSERIKGPNAP